MLKTHMAACLMATIFVAAPALAQTAPSAGTDRPTASGTGSTTSGSPAMQPAPTQGSSAGGSSGAMTQSSGAAGSSTTQPAGSPATGTTAMQPSGSTGGAATGGSSGTTATTGSSSATGAQPSTSGSAAMVPSGGQGGAMQGNFIAQLQNQQVMASRLIGTTVVSANNESIGDVNDIIMDRQGQIAGVVIGVGGFLGIGEKDVAVPFRALEITASANQGAMTSNNTGAGAGAANTNSTVATTGSTGSNDQQATASNRQTAMTGNTGNAGAGGAAQGNANNDGGVPDRIMLRMTKADLQAAPAFQTSRRGSGDNNASGGSTTNRQ
jgi:sporulation protein YlmC with PRC-barrel domain